MARSEPGRAWLRWIENGPPEPPAYLTRLALGLVVLVVAGLALQHARTKPLWFDEILTVMVTGIPTAGERWQALYDGADGMPPGYYALNTIVAPLPLDEHIRWRLPSLLGCLVALGAVYTFARTATNALGGLTATLLFALTPAAAYAYEARPYALLTGAVALAAVCWQRISLGWRWQAGFALSLVAVTNLHYLAPMTVVCFALAELALSLMTRRWRWPVWAGFCVAAVPPLLSLPILIKMKADFAASFWSRPDLAGLPYYYGNLIGLPVAATVTLIPLAFFGLARATLRADEARRPSLLLTAALLLVPLLNLALALTTHGGLHERYSIPVVIAYAVSLPLLIDWSQGAMPRAFTAALLLGFLICSTRESVLLSAYLPASRADYYKPARAILRKHPDTLLSLSNPLDYTEAWHYASPSERARLFYLGDLPGATRLSLTDGPMRILLAMQRHRPMRVVALERFLAEHDGFLLFTRGHPQVNWHPMRLQELGWRLEPLEPIAGGQLFRAHPPAGHP